jgi:hypothetical protein
VQANILHSGPYNRQATALCGEDVDLIGALPDIAKQAFNGIGALNVAVHRLRKGIKGQEVLFVLSQAADRLGIALSVLGFEGCQLDQCLRLCRLLPDANEFSLDLAALSSWDGIEHIALFMRPASAAEAWPKTVPRRQPTAHHARR